MADKPRPYRMAQRAESQEATRQRITESAVELHRSLGPSRTSISAVAEHAGVRRSTVYRHFPDMAALFDACTTHWLTTNPLPDLAGWAAIADPEARLRAALAEIYAFYGRAETMLENLIRDEASMPMVEERFAGFRGYLAGALDVLLQGRGLRGAARGRVRAAVGHAIAFSTWQSLTRDQQLSDTDAAALARAFVAAAGEDETWRRR
jgi:AcrR family transcriptional regulator